MPKTDKKTAQKELEKPREARKNRNSWEITIPLLLILVIAAGVYVYSSKNTKVEEAKKSAVVTEQKLQKEIEQLKGEMQELQKEKEKAVVAEIDCAKLGDEWVKFTREERGFSFCYKKSWGEPEFSETESDKGVIGSSGFSKADYLALGYGKTDILPEMLTSQAEPDFCWQCIDFEKDKAGISGESSVIEVETFVTEDRPSAVRILREFPSPSGTVKIKQVDYYMPNAFDGMDFRVKGYVTGKTDLIKVDEVLKTLVNSLTFEVKSQ